MCFCRECRQPRTDYLATETLTFRVREFLRVSPANRSVVGFISCSTRQAGVGEVSPGDPGLANGDDVIQGNLIVGDLSKRVEYRQVVAVVGAGVAIAASGGASV
jgi:hypothetical protein